MNDSLNIDIVGNIHYKIFNDSGIIETGDKSNAVVPNAQDIIRRTITGQSVYSIDKIEAYKLGILLATANISTVSYNITPNKVTVKAIFDEASFNDTLDEIRLISTIGGKFSEVTGLNILKNDTNQLMVEWTLTINFI